MATQMKSPNKSPVDTQYPVSEEFTFCGPQTLQAMLVLWDTTYVERLLA